MDEGTIVKSGVELYVDATIGKFKIHFTDKELLPEDAVGKRVSFCTAPEIFPPKNFDGWVRHRSLVILPSLKLDSVSNG